MNTPPDCLDSPFTFPIQPAKRMVYCVLRNLTTPDPRYQILSTLHVFILVDTSSTTTTEPILRFRLGILPTRTTISAKWKCMVKTLCKNTNLYRSLFIFSSIRCFFKYSCNRNMDNWMYIFCLPLLIKDI